MTKRFLAAFLSLVMVFSFTVSAYAENGLIDDNIVIENTVESNGEDPQSITEPNGDGDSFDAYEFDDAYDVGDDSTIDGTVVDNGGVTTCADCGSDPCTCEKENTESACETCGQEPCVCEPASPPQLCEVCNADPCVCEQEHPGVTAPVCPGDDSRTIEGCQNHNPPAPTGCEECGLTEGHAETCSLYEAPTAPAATTCPECGQTEGHSNTCITLCTCETDPDAECPIHPNCPTCGVKNGELHLKGCEKYIPVCNCGEDVVFHAAGCDFYLEPVTAEVYTETDGVYTVVDGHGESAPIDVEEYDGETIYVLTSAEPQNLYFEHGTFLGIGVIYSINDETYTRLNDTDDNTWHGSGKALVTVAAGVPDETEIILTADAGLFGKQTIAIKVIDEIPIDDNELEATIDGTTISVAGSEIPESVDLSASAVSEESYHENISNYIDNMDNLLGAFDIALVNEESTWQPENESVTVTLDVSAWNVNDGDKIVILHDHEGDISSLGKYTVRDGSITFACDKFSVFYFYLIFEFDGYEYFLSGGSEVYLSELLVSLGVEKDVTDVDSVEFSDPSLVEIEYVGGDWLITSLEAFGSEEYLTIVFDNGTEIEICVTDPVIYNYAVDNTITNVAKLPTTKNHAFGEMKDGDATAQGKSFTVNTNTITVEQVKAAGTTDATVTASHMVIYVTEGMAVRFIGGTTWPSDTSRPTYSSNSIWYWSWNGTDNYAIIKDGTAGRSATFPITVTVSGTAYYCNVTLLVVEDSAPTLLENELPEGYSIKNVPVTLYNYDGKAFNEYYNVKDGNYFAFNGTSKGVSSTENAGNRGWTRSGEQANGGGSVALMGIMKDRLVNGLPETSQGQKVDLFSTDTLNGAKEVYEDVAFQFIYNDKTGYYSYNSALNHAQYDSNSNEIELYKQSLAPSDTPVGASHGNAGFYPFENIYDAFTNTGYTALSESEWAEKLEDDAFELIPSQYSTDIALTSASNSTADMHYGLQVKSAFYLPEGKKLNGQNMIYEFTGDDDLWVYIDGQLVLDIGGGHTYVSGSFDLTTGMVWVEKYTQLAAADGGSYTTQVKGTDLRYKDSFLANLEDDQMHTIQIFYLERHGGVSNCRMHFNLPLAPMNAVEVSKTLVNQDGDTLSVTPNVEYTFQIFTAEDDDDNIDASDFKPLANKSFFGGKTTDEQGRFTLKAGETARFEGIPRFTEVYVIEIAPSDGYIYTESKVSVNGAAPADYQFGEQSATKIVKKDETMSFAFTNYMQTQPLTVKKQVVNGTKGLIDPEQEFEFVLDFTKSIVETGTGAISATDQAGASVALTDGGKFELKHGETVTIPRVPVYMTFGLRENNPDTTNGSFDDPKFESTRCTTTNTPNAFDTMYGWTIQDDGENEIVVTNQQRFNLTITKNGISNIDHDSDEQQSTIYTIVGMIDDEVIIEMDVAICGNDSITICRLPVGSYTVEEDSNWSWRYTPDSATKDVVITEDATASVTYVNTRAYPYWLSGDFYCENWFTTEGIKKRDGSDNVIG